MPAGDAVSRKTALAVKAISHRYGEHKALEDVTFEVSVAEIFGLLGPNGGGKTTLFRVLSTLFAVQSGTADILGADLVREPRAVRSRLGVVFQSPSLDEKLRVTENLRHQGHLYGMSGAALAGRIDTLLQHFELQDRAREVVENLSGGQQRRVEIAKALLHNPQLLLMDEPSTGLDPGARIELWKLLNKLRTEEGMTIVLTTHLMEEAEKCDRVAILHRGALAACGTPEALKSEVGGEVLTLHVTGPMVFAETIQNRFSVKVDILGNELRIEHPEAARLLAELKGAFPREIKTATLGQPTLEDVFIRRTGHRLTEEETIQPS